MRARHLTLSLVGSLCACMAGTAVSQAVSGTPSTASKSDVSFIKHAVGDGVAEVRLGKLALDKSSNDGVRKLAQLIVNDHTKANDDLRTLAHGKQVMLPTPASDDEANVAPFKDKDGAKFDQAWADTVVKDHQKAIAMFTTEKRQAQDPDVRNFTDKRLPVLGKHLQMARALQDALTLPDARDGAMGRHSAIGDSAFNHVSTPANAASAPTMSPQPARATSMGSH
jgi:putative membrane protein